MLNVNIFLSFFSLLCLLQISYFLFIVRAFLKHKNTFDAENVNDLELDFLFAVKDEINNVELVVKSLLKQSVFQESSSVRIIFVNDHSEDGTAALTGELEAKFPKKILSLDLPDGVSGKKAAINYGMEHTSNYVILLDADCRPATVDWALIMAKKLEKSDIVIGYGPFFKEQSLLNRLIRFECMWIATQYFGWNQKKKPYMGVGRNMAVKRDVHRDISSKVTGSNLISGDDDLFIKAAAGESTVDSVIDTRSFVYSAAENSYRAYINQKRRQISTSVYYKLYHQIALAIDAGVKILWPFLLVGIWCMLPASIAITCTLVFGVIQYVVHISFIRKLEERDLIVFLPLLVLLYGLHLSILAAYTLFSKNIRWK